MRVVWRGTISFGLVTIPVALYVATESKNVPSRQIHVPDGGRVQYKRVCSLDGAEVPYEEIGRGYESTTGELVVLSDVDLAALPAKTSRSIEIVSFLPQAAVDPIYFDRSYYVEPEKPGAKAYRLMRDALRKQGRLALAKVRLRDREILAVLRVQGEVLVLATMLWPDEVRQPKFPFLAEDDEWVSPTQELAMAEALIESLADEQLGHHPVPRRAPGNADRPDRRQGDRPGPGPGGRVRRGPAGPAERPPRQHRGGQAAPGERQRRTSSGRASRRAGQEEGQGAGGGRTRGAPAQEARLT